VTGHGVPGLGTQTVNIFYEQTNHTHADSFDKIVPSDFQLHVAALAVLSYVLADMPERLSDLR
jgi:carboxypeptidase Q